MMTNFETDKNGGELWIRLVDNTILPATSALSAIYFKYNSIDSPFYLDLKNNNITRFDMFYESIFIETPRGFLIEKIKFLEKNIQPFDNNNHFILLNSDVEKPDYWLDDNSLKVFITKNEIKTWNLSSVEITFDVYQFDIKTNFLNKKLSFDVKTMFSHSLYSQTPILEPCKVSYNFDTKSFNISTILRGPQKDFGLISVNIKKRQFLQIDEINSFIPYSSSKQINYNITLNKLLETDFYN